VKKSLAEFGDKLETGEKEKIEAAVKDLETALKSENKGDIDLKTEALMSASQKLGEKMYADQQAAAAAAGAATGGTGAGAAGAEAGTHRPNDDNIVDAEVKEVKKG
jgi:molecular chaperone DnaK